MGTIKAILRILSEPRSWFTGKKLKEGELCYETDDKGLKIGDGTTSYNSLPYLLPPRNNVDNKYLKCTDGEVEWADGEGSSYPPPGGVPYNDLSSDVQASLNKADTALQSETDPTVPSWAKQSIKPTYDYSEIANTPTIPTVNDATLKIQRNGTDIDTFTANASQNKTINIVVPTTANDVSALPASTKYGASLSLSINSSTYVITAQLKDQDNNNLGSAQTIDLPLESVVVNGSYDDATKKIILTLQNGNMIEFSVADLVSGLQTEITANNPLSADLIADGTTNKVYTATEQSKLSGIEAGAEVNVQSDWNQSDNTADDYIKNKPTIPAAQIQSDWNQGDNTALDYIKNKPAVHSIPAGGNAGQVLKKTSATDYDVNWANASETLPSAYCTTSGSTSAKKANCSLYVTQANQYLQVLIGSANTYQGALTLNINSAGAKPIYINGIASSSSNYTLPNGTYFVFYDGTNYYFRTDGKLPMKDADFGGSYNDLADKPTIPDVSTKYDTGDTAETTLDDADYVPFYDTSASDRRKSLWSNIKAKLKTYFDNYYLTSHQDISGKADKVSGATNGHIAGLDGNGNPTDSGIAGTDVSTAITNSHTHSNKSLLDTYTQTEVDLADAVSKKHSHSNKTILDMVPGSLGTAGQAIAVNDACTGLVFKTIGGGGGLTDYNFTHVANTTVSTSTTITFAANTRGSQMVSTSADLTVTFAVNNGSDNYLWIKNTGAADIDITISAVSAGGSPVSNVYIPDDGISVAAGKVCEIGIIVNADGAFITSRSDLSL